MSVLEALIAVILMQLATTLKGVILALATLDTQAMDFPAQVSAATAITLSYPHVLLLQYHCTVRGNVWFYSFMYLCGKQYHLIAFI